MNYSLKELSEIIGGKMHPDSDGNLKVTKIEYDSRKVEDDHVLFAAVKGEHTDGNKYVSSVLAKHKGGAIVTDESAFIKNTILVGDLQKALLTAANHYRKNTLKNTKCVCITGSVGKTTTKEMTFAVLSKMGKAYKTAGNMNSTLGLPATVLHTPPDCEFAVYETGMSEPGEISRLSYCAQPDIAIITNIGTSHIAAFGSREGICAEKADIAKGLKPDGKLLLCGDEPLLLNNALFGANNKNKFFFSVNNKDSDFAAKNIKQIGFETEFDFVCKSGECKIKIPLLGLHNVSNAACAFAAGLLLGGKIEKIKNAFDGFRNFGSRQDIYSPIPGITVISDCYNASCESVKAALGVLEGMSGTRIAVLGDMLELGDRSRELHLKVGNSVFKKADILITLGSESFEIARGAKEAGMKEENIYSFENGSREKAAALVKEKAKGEASFLFKASNRMNLGEIIKLSGLDKKGDK